MTKRIFKNNVLCALCAVLATAALMLIVVFSVFEGNQQTWQKDEAAIIAYTLEKTDDDPDYLRKLTSINARITLIAPDGTVQFDNYTAAENMENHGDRPEVAQALESGSGENKRQSVTLGLTTYYYALRLSDGSVLRLATTTQNVLGVLVGVMQPLLLILIAVVAATFYAAKRSAAKIVKPINELNLAEPLENTAYDELAPLLRRMDKQNKALHESMKELSRKQRQFLAVTENMSEGMIILDSAGSIISINKAAAGIFEVEGDCAGKPLVAVSRSFRLKDAAEKALCGRASEEVTEIDGRSFQILGSPVLSGQTIKGAVLLAMDVTEKLSAEKDRREFTANVSHELKTPLTSIMGYAEIMKSGLAREEDTKEFSSRIYDESRRLLALVEDIMRLSQLDEQANLPQWEQVPLLELSKQVCGRLEPVAQAAGVTVEVSGQEVQVNGIRNVLEELIFNLVDNGIKYNVAGGSVTVTVDQQEGRPVLMVKDTGLGIPKSHQSRIFERFYRVDKSHSKATCGTGLGLSIVKHAARLHGAAIQLDSDEGKGTSVKVIF